MPRTSTTSQAPASRRVTVPGLEAWRAAQARRPWLREVAIFGIALVVYQVSRMLVIGEPSTAFQNAAGLIDFEKSSGLFVELSIQQWLLNHLALTSALNKFYMVGHWIITPLFFVWLYRRRRRVYPYVRNAFLAANAIALAVFVVFPVAPPRLIDGDGFVDTLSGVSNIDLHGGVLSGLFNPHAAVPSMHFGYAFMIGVVAALLLQHWALRLLALSYPALVVLTITGTANHYVFDSLAGGTVIAAGFVAVQAWQYVWPALRSTPAAAALRRGA
ncbi:MAG: phosphatase PAP2 family protein [Thermoleophilia bacterium]|nr:phosphatase PAP2 family protein [Thermoleophilia bacterium]